MLQTSGHSSAYNFSSNSTARKARMTCLHADSIVPFDRPRAIRRGVVMLGLEFLLNSSYHLVLEVAASVRYP
jgi:hypothetical protein